MKPDGTANGFLESFRHALEGVTTTARERNFRVQLAAGAAAVALGAFFRISPGEWIAVALCIGLVLGGECANTALEAAVDLASPGRHPLAKRAKDAAAGAVLLFSLASAAVGAIVFLPRLAALVRGLAGV
jgi:diacylglycerol kinase